MATQASLAKDKAKESWELTAWTVPAANAVVHGIEYLFWNVATPFQVQDASQRALGFADGSVLKIKVVRMTGEPERYAIKLKDFTCRW